MQSNYSMTYTGLIVSILGFILNQLGVAYEQNQLIEVVGGGTIVVGWLVALVGRWRQGDISWWGKKNIQ